MCISYVTQFVQSAYLDIANACKTFATIVATTQDKRHVSLKNVSY